MFLPREHLPSPPKGFFISLAQPKSFYIRVLQQRTTTASSSSKGRWHKSWWGWFSALPAPGMLESTAELSSAREIPMKDINCPELGSGWLNPGMNLYVLCKQVEKHKWCQEVLAGPQPSGNCGQATAKKYISRRVPTLPLPGQCADTEEDESSLQIRSLTPTHPPISLLNRAPCCGKGWLVHSRSHQSSCTFLSQSGKSLEKYVGEKHAGQMGFNRGAQ